MYLETSIVQANGLPGGKGDFKDENPAFGYNSNSLKSTASLLEMLGIEQMNLYRQSPPIIPPKHTYL
jgi:hypothetical protein